MVTGNELVRVYQMRVVDHNVKGRGKSMEVHATNTHDAQIVGEVLAVRRFGVKDFSLEDIQDVGAYAEPI